MADDEFRRRLATPVLMLLGVLAGIALIAFSISRVLLAVPQAVATMLALVLAAYVLLVAGVVTRQRRVPGRTLAAGLVVGLVALGGAGVVAAQAGPRELHHWADAHDDAQPPEDGEEAPAAEIPADAFVWVAIDIDFAEEPATLPAGEVTIAIDNQGNLPHNVFFPDLGHRVDADGGQQDWDTFTFDPGEYSYLCDIPGHEATMSGTVVVE